MTSYLKVIPWAVGAVTLLASPVMARTVHHAASASAPSYSSPAPQSFVTPYGADVRQPVHSGSVNPDFQVPGNNH